jgi:hypothetical protein
LVAVAVALLALVPITLLVFWVVVLAKGQQQQLGVEAVELLLRLLALVVHILAAAVVVVLTVPRSGLRAHLPLLALVAPLLITEQRPHLALPHPVAAVVSLPMLVPLALVVLVVLKSGCGNGTSNLRYHWA